jgi:hypothetical protein
MRRGSLLTEAGITLAAFAAVSLIAVGVLADRRDARRGEARAAALETAQNLLARLRHGETAAPAGWTIERRPLTPGVVEVRVRGEGVALATLVAEVKP